VRGQARRFGGRQRVFGVALPLYSSRDGGPIVWQVD
jgi:hypothetical protein